MVSLFVENWEGGQLLLERELHGYNSFAQFCQMLYCMHTIRK